jgi:opacity protein-like surface antigen
MKGVVFNALALSIISQAASAGTMGNVAPTSSIHPLLTFTIGPDFVKAGREQTLSLLPPFENHYTNDNTYQTVLDVGGFLGFEYAFSNQFSTQLGVSGYYDSNLNTKGNVWQFALPIFDNLTYKFKIQHARVMVGGKVLSALSSFTSLHPYFSWEVGAAFNRALNYEETPIVPTVLPTTPFADHTQTSFAYGVGVGLDYNVSKQIRVGVGYQFADFGSVSLGPTPAALTNQSLSIPHLYTNQLRFQLTYLI